MAFSVLHPLYPQRAMSNDGTAIASQSTTASTAAIAPTGYTQSSVNLVTFDVQVSDVRVRWDGTDPTGTVGHILPAGTAYTWDVAQYNASKFIRISTASSDAIIFASPFSAQ